MIEMSGQALQGFPLPTLRITDTIQLPCWGYQMKTCKKCGGTSFYSNGRCKPCAIARAKKWHAENPDKAKTAKKKYADVNRDKVRQSNREYASRNKEKMSAYAKEYRAANLQKELNRSARWRSANPDYLKNYYYANKGVSQQRSKAWQSVRHTGSPTEKE